MSKEKKCCACLETLPIDAFSKDRTRKDGKYMYCRKCNSKLRKGIIEPISRRRARSPMKKTYNMEILRFNECMKLFKPIKGEKQS